MSIEIGKAAEYLVLADLLLLDRLHERIGFSVARLAQGYEVAERVGLPIVGKPSERLDMVDVGTGHPAMLTRCVVSSAGRSLLGHPVRAAVVRHALAFVLRVQWPDSVFIAANARAKSCAAFGPGPAEFRLTADANMRRQRIGALAGGSVLAFTRAMFSAAIFGAGGLDVERFCAVGAVGFGHGESMGRC